MIGRGMIRRARLWLRLFGLGERGLALVEFAIALPVMLLLYLGGWQLSDAISCNRKVTIAARGVADLTSQYASVSGANLQAIINASTQIMAPYDASNATVRVTQLYTDANGNTKVVWSYPDTNEPANRLDNVAYALPSTMVSNNTYLILGEVSYNYTPVALYGVTGPMTLKDSVYMSPRISSSVTKTP